MKTKAINKPRLNYVIDLVIAAGFVLVVASGLVLLVAGSGGFQGGRNPQFRLEILSLARWTWKGIHNWSAAVMGGGVLLHLALHWKWIKCMTRSPLRRNAGRPEAAQAAVVQCERYE